MAGNKTETQIGLKINGEIAAKTIRDLETEVKNLNRELRMLPVGSQEFADKAKELGQATNNLNEVRDATRQVRNQMVDVGDTAKKARADLLAMSPVGQMIQGFQASFVAVRAAIMANVASMGLLKVAIAATGIGALVLAVIALVTYFTKTEEGAIALDGAMKALGIIMEGLTQVIASVGEFLVKMFTNPLGAMKDLADFLVQNIINRFTAFGVILKAIASADLTKLNDGFIQLTTGVENASEKAKAMADELQNAIEVGRQLAELNDQLDEDESNNLVRNAQLETSIAKLLVQAKDRSKSDQDRLVLLRQAARLEEERLKNDLNIAATKTKIAAIELDQIKKTSAEYDAAYRKFKQAKADEIRLQGESLTLQEKIANRQNALLDEIADKQKKDEEARQKAAEKAAADREKKIAKQKQREEEERRKQEAADRAALQYAQKLTDLRIANIENEFDRKDALIMVQFERELATLQANGQLTAEIAIELEKQQDAALLKNRFDREAAEQERKKKKKEDEIKAAEDQIALDEERQNLEIDRLVAAETVKEEKLYQVKRAGLEKRLNLLKENGKGETVEAQRIALAIEKLDVDQSQKRIELAKKTKLTEEQLNIARLDLFKNTVSGIKAALAEDETNRRKFSGIIKALTVAEIAMQGIKEISGIWSNANMNALNAVIPGWGPAFAAIQSAFAATRTTFAVTKAAGITFEKGGMITPKGGYLSEGGRHSEGGIQLLDGRTGAHLGEVERGEFLTVFSRTAYQNNKSTIDALLNASLYRGGAPIEGRKYADGGMIDLGTKAGAGGDSAAVNVTLAQAQIAEMRRLNDAFTAFPKQLSAVVVYEQQQKQHQEAARIESRANG